MTAGRWDREQLSLSLNPMADHAHDVRRQIERSEERAALREDLRPDDGPMPLGEYQGKRARLLAELHDARTFAAGSHHASEIAGALRHARNMGKALRWLHTEIAREVLPG